MLQSLRGLVDTFDIVLVKRLVPLSDIYVLDVYPLQIVVRYVVRTDGAVSRGQASRIPGPGFESHRCHLVQANGR